MTFVIIGVAALFLWLFPALRCAVTHPFHCLYYAAKDGYKYIKYKQGNLRKTGNLDIFCGYFGNGKTCHSSNRLCAGNTSGTTVCKSGVAVETNL